MKNLLNMVATEAAEGPAPECIDGARPEAVREQLLSESVAGAATGESVKSTESSEGRQEQVEIQRE